MIQRNLCVLYIGLWSVTANAGDERRFHCKEGQSIPLSYHCDGDYDCTDMSDEENCEDKTCDERMFQCKVGYCVRLSYRCDGDYDCTDMSDEENCEAHTCDEQRFHCKTGQCIPLSRHCDGSNDCNDKSDEESCEAHTCDEQMFRCKTGKCIRITYRCDGYIDCTDSSDEENCKGNNTCREDQFMCANHPCIPIGYKCDGSKDCSDGSDENNCNFVTSVDRKEYERKPKVTHEDAIFTATSILPTRSDSSSRVNTNTLFSKNGKTDNVYILLTRILITNTTSSPTSAKATSSSDSEKSNSVSTIKISTKKAAQDNDPIHVQVTLISVGGILVTVSSMIILVICIKRRQKTNEQVASNKLDALTMSHLSTHIYQSEDDLHTYDRPGTNVYEVLDEQRHASVDGLYQRYSKADDKDCYHESQYSTLPLQQLPKETENSPTKGNKGPDVNCINTWNEYESLSTYPIVNMYDTLQKKQINNLSMTKKDQY